MTACFGNPGSSFPGTWLLDRIVQDAWGMTDWIVDRIRRRLSGESIPPDVKTYPATLTVRK